jgi:hypothetical protein
MTQRRCYGDSINYSRVTVFELLSVVTACVLSRVGVLKIGLTAYVDATVIGVRFHMDAPR